MKTTRMPVPSRYALLLIALIAPGAAALSCGGSLSCGEHEYASDGQCYCSYPYLRRGGVCVLPQTDGDSDASDQSVESDNSDARQDAELAATKELSTPATCREPQPIVPNGPIHADLRTGSNGSNGSHNCGTGALGPIFTGPEHIFRFPFSSYLLAEGGAFMLRVTPDPGVLLALSVSVFYDADLSTPAGGVASCGLDNPDLFCRSGLARSVVSGEALLAPFGSNVSLPKEDDAAYILIDSLPLTGGDDSPAGYTVLITRVQVRCTPQHQRCDGNAVVQCTTGGDDWRMLGQPCQDGWICREDTDNHIAFCQQVVVDADGDLDSEDGDVQAEIELRYEAGAALRYISISGLKANEPVDDLVYRQVDAGDTPGVYFGVVQSANDGLRYVPPALFGGEFSSLSPQYIATYQMGGVSITKEGKSILAINEDNGAGGVNQRCLLGAVPEGKRAYPDGVARIGGVDFDPYGDLWLVSGGMLYRLALSSSNTLNAYSIPGVQVRGVTSFPFQGTPHLLVLINRNDDTESSVALISTESPSYLIEETKLAHPMGAIGYAAGVDNHLYGAPLNAEAYQHLVRFSCLPFDAACSDW